nr:hypothetical protein [Thiocapsa sp. KS1]
MSDQPGNPTDGLRVGMRDQACHARDAAGDVAHDRSGPAHRADDLAADLAQTAHEPTEELVGILGAEGIGHDVLERLLGVCVVVLIGVEIVEIVVALEVVHGLDVEIGVVLIGIRLEAFGEFVLELVLEAFHPEPFQLVAHQCGPFSLCGCEVVIEVFFECTHGAASSSRFLGSSGILTKAEPRIATDQGIDKGAGFPDAT